MVEETLSSRHHESFDLALEDLVTEQTIHFGKSVPDYEQVVRVEIMYAGKRKARVGEGESLDYARINALSEISGWSVDGIRREQSSISRTYQVSEQKKRAMSAKRRPTSAAVVQAAYKDPDAPTF